MLIIKDRPLVTIGREAPVRLPVTFASTVPDPMPDSCASQLVPDKDRRDTGNRFGIAGARRLLFRGGPPNMSRIRRARA